MALQLTVLSNGAATNSGTDAYNTFNGKADMAGVVNYGSSSGWYIDLTIAGLDPNKTYTFATTANRDDATYTTRISRYTISDISAATNASTSGVTVISNESVSFLTGYNTVNGYVARWTGIQPGLNGNFIVRADYPSNYQAYGMSVFMLAEEVGTDPTITTVGTLSDFNSPVSVYSAEQSYTVNGYNLTEDISVTAPADFEVSTATGTGFGSSVSLPASGGTVYVRFLRSSLGESTGNIIHTSSGVTKNLAVKGTAGTPTVTTSVPTLTAFTSSAGAASAEQSYTVAGSYLINPIVITAPPDFQVSTTSGTGFGTTVSLTPISGMVATTPIYSRFLPRHGGQFQWEYHPYLQPAGGCGCQRDRNRCTDLQYVQRQRAPPMTRNKDQATRRTSITLLCKTYLSSTRQYWGLRFQTVAVPKDATITSASITFRAAAASTGTPVMTLWGEDIDDAPAFTAGNFNSNIQPYLDLCDGLVDDDGMDERFGLYNCSSGEHHPGNRQPHRVGLGQRYGYHRPRSHQCEQDSRGMG